MSSDDDSYTFNFDLDERKLTVKGRNLEFRDAALLLVALVIIVGFLTGGITL